MRGEATREKSKVKGAGGKRILTDLVSLVASPRIRTMSWCHFRSGSTPTHAWLSQQESLPPLPQGEGRGEGGVKGRFASEQLHWLEMIRDHVAANLGIGPDDFEVRAVFASGWLRKGTSVVSGRSSDHN